MSDDVPPVPPLTCDKCGTPLLFCCRITCDGCGHVQEFAEGTSERLDAAIDAAGWQRFAPTGSDLCWLCKGASPNTIIQVRKPCP